MSTFPFLPTLRHALVLIGAAWLLQSSAAAQTAEPVDPPARVGRISALRGPVDSSHEAGAAWEPAQLNQPVTTQTALWAPPGSQAEVRIGSASVRLDDNTQAVFSQLDDHGIAIDVAQGSVRARVRSLPTGDHFSLAADGVRVDALGPGDYRVDYDPDRRAYTVRSLAGRLRIVTPSNRFDLEPGQESLVENGGANLSLRPLGPRDDFDAWAEARDREQDRLASARYVSSETTGIEALDEHGRWDVVAEYGAVWYPRALPYGWAPYRYGHWAWVAPWGWTWVDDAPWGFAPFHYGRWALIGGVWGWVPGPIVARPCYAPALVGYVGGRSGSISIGIGLGAPIGWFPLAPREVYVPPYRYSPRYSQQINLINITTVIRNAPADDRRVGRPAPPDRPVYRYAQRPEAVTVVGEDQFRQARSIGRERLELTPQQAAQLRPVTVAEPGRRIEAAPGAAPVAQLPSPPRRDGRLDDLRRTAPERRGERPRFEAGDAGTPSRNPPPAQMPQPGPGPAFGGPAAPRSAPAPAVTPVAPMPVPPVELQRDPGARDDRPMRRPAAPRDDENRGERGRRPLPYPAPDALRTPPPTVAVPQTTPAPQVIPRPVPVPQVTPAPQVIPRPVPVPAPAPQQVQPQPQQPPAVHPGRAPDRGERDDRRVRGGEGRGERDRDR